MNHDVRQALFPDRESAVSGRTRDVLLASAGYVAAGELPGSTRCTAVPDFSMSRMAVRSNADPASGLHDDQETFRRAGDSQASSPKNASWTRHAAGRD